MTGITTTRIGIYLGGAQPVIPPNLYSLGSPGKLTNSNTRSTFKSYQIRVVFIPVMR